MLACLLPRHKTAEACCHPGCYLLRRQNPAASRTVHRAASSSHSCHLLKLATPDAPPALRSECAVCDGTLQKVHENRLPLNGCKNIFKDITLSPGSSGGGGQGGKRGKHGMQPPPPAPPRQQGPRGGSSKKKGKRR